MNKTITIIIVIVIIALGGYFLLKSEDAQTPNTAPVAETPSTPSGTGETPIAAKVVTYTDEGYSPSPLTIKVGETVDFQNKSEQNMWTASGMHPTHSAYSGTTLSEHCPDQTNTAFDSCRAIPPGSSWLFTFTKVGAWGYHDHLHPTLFGRIVVE